MGRSGIEWTDHTINPGLYGCDKVSPACERCYAATLAARLARMGIEEYEGTTVPPRAGKPVNWVGGVKVRNRLLKAFGGLPRKKQALVFVTSMSDVFHVDVPQSFHASLFAMMRSRRNLTFLVLTKRMDLALLFLRSTPVLPNVWIGATIEDQKRADERGPLLWEANRLGWHTFASMEPLLEMVDVSPYLALSLALGAEWDECLCGELDESDRPCLVCGSRYGIEWVIVGGESGAGARAMKPFWAMRIKAACLARGVRFFFKQWGAHVPPGGVDEDGMARLDGVRHRSRPPLQF